MSELLLPNILVFCFLGARGNESGVGGEEGTGRAKSAIFEPIFHLRKYLV